MKRTPHPSAVILEAIAEGRPLERNGAPEIAPGNWEPASYDRALSDMRGNQDITRWWRVAQPKLVIPGDHGEVVPLPMTDFPDMGRPFFLPSLTTETFINHESWNGSSWQIEVFKRGLVHATQEGAAAHAKALLSFSHDLGS